MPESNHCIYWLLAERTPASPGEVGVFLSAGEQRKLSTMRFPKRRDDWLLGRWAAKSLILSLPAYEGFSLAEIEIVNTAEGAPQICLPGGKISPHCLSISHSSGLAFCALTQVPGLRVGVDLETVEPRSNAFMEDYFTPGERRLAASFPAEEAPLIITLIWSMKESMLKALGMGLRQDTRREEVLTVNGYGSEGWQEAVVHEPENQSRSWVAWWQQRSGFVMTVAGFTERAGPFSISLVEQRAWSGL